MSKKSGVNILKLHGLSKSILGINRVIASW